MTTKHTASIAKKLVEERGILLDPNPQKGKQISQNTVDKIKHLYYSEEISRIMPGRKYCISVIDLGEKKLHSKHLLLQFEGSTYYLKIRIPFSR